MGEIDTARESPIDTRESIEKESGINVLLKGKAARLQPYSLWQTFTYTWMNPLFTKGASKTLQLNDLEPVPEAYDLSVFEKRITQAWEREKLYSNQPDLALVLRKEFMSEILVDGSFKLIGDLLNVCSPLLLNLLVTYIANTKTALASPSTTEVPALWIGIVYSLALLFISFIGSLFNNHQIQRTTSFALNLRYALTSLIYKKAMNLSYLSRQTFDSSKVVSMVSTDCARIEMFLINVNYIWTAPIQVVITISFLLWVIGWPCLIGLVVLGCIYPCQNIIMNALRSVRRIVAPLTDDRVKRMQEIVLGIRIVKFFAWEESYMQGINEIRIKELAQVLRKGFIQANMMVIAFTFPVFAGVFSIVLFSAVASVPVSINAAVLFSALAWFTQLRGPLFWFPQALTFKADSDVGLDRISLLFNAPEMSSGAETIPQISTTPASSSVGQETAIKLVNAEFKWDTLSPQSHPSPKTKNESKQELVGHELVELHQHPSQLFNINSYIPKGSLVAIVGPVGSGKSTLLNALIGEATKVSGQLLIAEKATVGFASQQPWIQNASIKDNIIFGREFDQQRYLRAIRDSALERDLETLQDGDLTEIGERGINLSGGQKQRVSLARLLYFNADICLLDDPLSAVDVHVGQYLFNHCLKGGLASKTRILVTHQLSVLPNVDSIIVLKEGRVVEMGTFKDLMERKGEFAQFLETQQLEKEEDEEETRENNSLNDDEYHTALPRIEKMLIEKSLKESRVLMQEEERAIGAVSPEIWFNYIISSGFWLLLACFSTVAFQFIRVLTDYWLVFWIQDSFTTSALTYQLSYIGLVFAQTFVVWFLSYCFAKGSVTGAKKLHEKALERVLKAPISFFETTPVGRILNRFSKDQDGVDNAILDSLRRFIINFTNAIAVFVVIMINTPIFGIPLIFILVFYYYIQQHYRKTSRELKRIDSVSRSPLYAQIGETLGGLATIRAFREESRFVSLNEKLVRNNHKPYYNLMSATQWLSLRLEFTSAFIVFFAALFGVLSRETPSYTASKLGLTLTYAFSVTMVINFCIKLFIEAEISMNQVERIDYFGNCLEQEAPLYLPETSPKSEWPEKGVVEFCGVCARYAPTLPLVLKSISVKIESCEKIGIVGRTGSGKSTIIQTLFRTIEAVEGQIIIDGIDIKTLGLAELRRKIGIIPQDPVLFAGTVRRNLDPFGQCSDDRLWDCLQRSSMKSKIQEMGAGLDSMIELFGSNLSVGQRQLLCLARALVLQPKILVMDEATANVDYETDLQIQKCLRQDLKECTLLTIAHRLNTILDYDRILVLDDGKVVEFDSPSVLLERKDGYFSSMVRSHNN